jgi:hypothetical protein
MSAMKVGFILFLTILAYTLVEDALTGWAKNAISPNAFHDLFVLLVGIAGFYFLFKRIAEFFEQGNS